VEIDGYIVYLCRTCRIKGELKLRRQEAAAIFLTGTVELLRLITPSDPKKTIPKARSPNLVVTTGVHQRQDSLSITAPRDVEREF
jgi:hypothetical protein